jgi:hypothetical protein
LTITEVYLGHFDIADFRKNARGELGTDNPQVPGSSPGRGTGQGTINTSTQYLDSFWQARATGLEPAQRRKDSKPGRRSRGSITQQVHNSEQFLR